MKIAVNFTYLMDGKRPEGIGKYALNLFKGLQSIGKLNKNFHIFVANNFCEECEGLFPEATIIPVAAVDNYDKWHKYHRFIKLVQLDRYLVPRFLRRARYDLFFHPYSAVDDYISREVPTLVTIHDLFFKNYPQEFSRKYLKYMNYRYKDIIYNTRHLVVPSQFVKQDILKFYPDTEPGKITVINNPVWINSESSREVEVNKPYILSVGAIRNHKNLITLLKAFQLIQHKVEHCLVLTGAKGHLRIDPGKYAAEQHIDKVIMTGYLPDDQRNYLYQHADLFVSPSLHEGFGMTPVEAALLETPVLTTRATSIPEVTKDMVNYYEPATDPQVLAAQILNLLQHRPPRNDLHEIKNTLAQEYSPEKIAVAYFALFERLVGR